VGHFWKPIDTFGLEKQPQGIGNVPMILHNEDTHTLQARTRRLVRSPGA
jgi:hypothetical protein